MSGGQLVKTMILNRLGLVSSPLYLFGNFFEGKATEHLIGEVVKAEYLKNDREGASSRHTVQGRTQSNICFHCYRSYEKV